MIPIARADFPPSLFAVDVQAASTPSAAAWVNLAYLVAAVLFMLTFKCLSHPRSATRGNILGAVGMAIAIAAAMIDPAVKDYRWAVLGMGIGAVVGAVLALRIHMTAMPQMVGLLNGFGGGASLFVAGATLHEALEQSQLPMPWGQAIVATAVSGLIGAVTLSGSFVAFAKLQELKAFKKPIVYAGHQAYNLLLIVAGLAVAAALAAQPTWWPLYWLLVIVACGLGIMITLPIGGADMPVVICLLNSYSGMAAAATGFVLANNVLIIAGSLVGASGLILTRIMCRAMNRPLANVLFGIGAGDASSTSEDEVYAGKIKAAGPEELAMLFDGARRVVIVPGYGLAVAQAQHAVRDLMDLLESRGAQVLFGIHPVAGRMPGHMNVLLAEAEIGYDKMLEMDDVNPLFAESDVAIVIGANDVVNPLAKTDPKSPIAGMPILEVGKSRTVVVIKRSLSPGFAGIPNPLFAAENTLMYFADGKKAVLDLAGAIKEAG